MIEYRQRVPEPKRTATRGHRRIALLVFALGLVLVLMDHARRPQTWHWLWGGKPPADAAVGADAPAEVAAAPVDTRLAALRPSLELPDTFRSPPAGDVPDKVFPGVRPGYFVNVEDDTVFRGVEDDAWFHLFEALREAQPGELAAAARPVDFAQLFQQPAEYRGRLVKLSGRVRRLEALEAPTNTYGVEQYYRAVLETSANPVFVYFLDLPAGFPVGERVYEDVSVSGFFFKRLAYRAVDDIRTAPVIAARTLDWSPRAAAAQPIGSSPWLPWIVLAAVSYAGWWTWRLWNWRRPGATPLWARHQPAETTLPIDPSFEAIDPRAALDALAREHHDDR